MSGLFHTFADGSSLAEGAAKPRVSGDPFATGVPAASAPGAPAPRAGRSLEAVILKTAPDALLVIDGQGRVAEWNPAAERILGYSREEALGRRVAELILPPSSREAHCRGLARHLASGESAVLGRRVEVVAVRKDGEEFPAELSVMSARPPGDGPPLFVAHLRDITDRRQAEAALTAILRSKDQFMEAVPALLYVLDRAGRLVRWNRKLEAATGLNAKELAGRKAVGFFPPERRREITAAIRAAFAGSVGQIEARLGPPGGVEATYLWNGAPLRDERGEVAGIVGFGLDITERKAAEAACRRGEDLLRTIIDSSRAVVYLKDTDGRYQLINRQWGELFGVTQGSVLDKTDRDIFPPPIAEAFRANDLAVLAGGRAVELEEIAPHDDGPHTYLSIKVPLPGPDGAPYAICGISTDITERKRMEEALRQEEERFRGAFQAATIGMALVDRDGRWLRVNPALCRMVGYSEEELLTTNFQALTHPDDLEADLGLMRRALDGEIGSYQMEKRYLHKRGDVVWALLSVSPVRDAAGGPLNFVAQVEDVTPRKRAEERARVLHAEIQEAYDATIAGWARALDLRDHETEGHSRRVTELTLRLARALGLPESELVHIRRGALLHDIGKMGIPDAILLKPGPLSDDEWAIMKRHPDLAAEMLAPVQFLRPALDIPRCHHERWDGTGYPRGLAGEAIPLAARAFAVVDIWDALSHDRPYRPAWPADRVLDHIRTLAGTHLDPAVVSTFLRLPVQDLEAAERTAPPAVPEGRPAPRVAPPASLGTDAVADPARLAALRGTGLLDSPAERAFDRLTRLASKVLHAPVALVSLVDEQRQFFKSACGLPEPWAMLRQTPLSHSFCRQVVRSACPLVIPDARLDPRVRDNRAVAELGVIAYAGMPLTTSSGHVLGSFCVIDGRPRAWDDGELEILRDLAASVMTEIELRGDIAARRQVEEALRESRRRVAEQLALAHELNRELERQRLELAAANGSLAEMAATDGLTGLRNRRHFAEALPDAHARAERQATPLSVILADVDEFKPYNDTFGHPAGDEVLRLVAETLASQVRNNDLTARYGGEEFVILLPGASASDAEALAERLRKAVEARTWPHRPITASFGVATTAAGDDGPWDLVNRADVALYHSKRSGRNRVTHHRALPAVPN